MLILALTSHRFSWRDGLLWASGLRLSSISVCLESANSSDKCNDTITGLQQLLDLVDNQKIEALNPCLSARRLETHVHL